MEKSDWAKEKAVDTWKQMAADTHRFDYDLAVLTQALREAEARGMERAAKLFDGDDLQLMHVAASIRAYAAKESPR